MLKKMDKNISIFENEDPYDMLDDGECMSVEMSIDGEEVKVEACREGENISIESIEPIEMEGEIKKFDKEDDSIF